MKKEKILKNASFEIKDGVNLLRMKGTPFEMGYQHGYLLADKISVMINTTLQATIAYIALATGNDLATSEEWFWLGQKAAEPFLPEEFKEEMKGIATGCKDEDNFNMPGQLENRIMFVADPDNGYGHVFMSYPGMIGLDGGFNEAGFEMMTQLNSMKEETMEGCGIAVFTRLLLTHVNNVDDAIAVFNKYPRCAGIAYHVADAINKKAAVVETSATQVTVRYPVSGQSFLYQANNSNCYPGWMGYEGYNMVLDQAPVNELTDVSTIDAWQASIRDPENKYVQAPSRDERYGELLAEHYGNITVETAKEIMSDRFDPYTQKEREKWEPSVSNNILCTICALYPDETFHAAEPLGEFKAHIANMWSLIAIPETGDFWLAINDFPAEYGGYVQFNLKDLLKT